MIDDRSVLAVIPARGGSKGLPRKNLLPLAGLPLLAHSIRHAQASSYVDRIICSTEDEEIASVAREYGGEVPFLRPAELATDSATTPEVIFDLLGKVELYDYVVILQPTSPLRAPSDIDDSVRLCHQCGAPSVTTVCESDKSPHWMFTLEEGFMIRPIMGEHPLRTRRQDLPQAYALNGAVYVLRWDALERRLPFVAPETRVHVMPKERSIDIDSKLDFEFANFLMGAR